MATIDPTHYAYRVVWSAPDGEHVATVAEFPSLSWLAGTPHEALSGLLDLVAGVLDDMARAGEPVPQPLSERTFSGRFNVRIPAELHRSLVLEAAEQNVSLNRLVSDRLARPLYVPNWSAEARPAVRADEAVPSLPAPGQTVSHLGAVDIVARVPHVASAEIVSKVSGREFWVSEPALDAAPIETVVFPSSAGTTASKERPGRR